MIVYLFYYQRVLFNFLSRYQQVLLLYQRVSLSTCFVKSTSYVFKKVQILNEYCLTCSYHIYKCYFTRHLSYQLVKFTLLWPHQQRVWIYSLFDELALWFKCTYAHNTFNIELSSGCFDYSQFVVIICELLPADVESLANRFIYLSRRQSQSIVHQMHCQYLLHKLCIMGAANVSVNGDSDASGKLHTYIHIYIFMLHKYIHTRNREHIQIIFAFYLFW